MKVLDLVFRALCHKSGWLSTKRGHANCITMAITTLFGRPVIAMDRKAISVYKNSQCIDFYVLLINSVGLLFGGHSSYNKTAPIKNFKSLLPFNLEKFQMGCKFCFGKLTKLKLCLSSEFLFAFKCYSLYE